MHYGDRSVAEHMYSGLSNAFQIIYEYYPNDLFLFKAADKFFNDTYGDDRSSCGSMAGVDS